MNCQRIQESFLDYQAGALPAADSAAIREHLKSCLTCQREWAGLQTTLLQLDRMPVEEPSPRMRANFYTMLEEHRRAADEPSPFAQMRSRVDRFFEVLLPSRPAWQFAFSFLLLVAGLVLGARYLHQAAPAPTVDPATAKELADLRAKVDSVGQLVTYSLLQQQSTTDRLKGVLATLDLKSPDQKVLNDLIGALAFDPSTNVRLAAVDALYPHADSAVVRASIPALLDREQSPLVQVAMINFVAASGDRDAAPSLEKLVRNETIDKAVREAARRALAQL
jgi:HEAT repeats/Putative zinc-finger